MPNWTNAKDYEFTKNLTNTQWAWEFLRRIPAYIEDWEIAQIKQQKFSEFQAGSHFNYELNPHIFFEPPIPEDETADPEDDPPPPTAKAQRDWAFTEGVETLSPMMKYGRDWLLSSTIHDPAADTPPNFQKLSSTQLTKWGDISKSFNDISDGDGIYRQMLEENVVVTINLDFSNASICEDIEILITRIRNKTGIKEQPQKHYKKKTNWPIFLRIIDGKTAGATDIEIATVLLAANWEKDKKASNDDMKKLKQYHEKIAKHCFPENLARLANTPNS